MIPGDTDPQAHRIQMEVLRRMTGPQRLAVALEMSDLARAFSLAGLRGRRPGASERDLLVELARLSFWPEQPPDGLK